MLRIMRKDMLRQNNLVREDIAMVNSKLDLIAVTVNNLRLEIANLKVAGC